MKTECFVILLIILLLVIDLLRRHRKNYALCCLPLTLVPFFHIVADFSAGKFIAGDIASARLILITDLAATLATVLLLYFLQNQISGQKRRNLFFSFSSGYSVLLATILILFSVT